eukprot:29017-Eustigmatos_ZCMA.PRE.1
MLGSRSPVTSQWDGDLALVVLRVPPEGPHVAGITAADEGIYYVRSVTGTDDNIVVTHYCRTLRTYAYSWPTRWCFGMP